MQSCALSPNPVVPGAQGRTVSPVAASASDGKMSTVSTNAAVRDGAIPGTRIMSGILAPISKFVYLSSLQDICNHGTCSFSVQFLQS